MPTRFVAIVAAVLPAAVNILSATPAARAARANDWRVSRRWRVMVTTACPALAIYVVMAFHAATGAGGHGFHFLASLLGTSDQLMIGALAVIPTLLVLEV